jgi:hypothetical protein
MPEAVMNVPELGVRRGPWARLGPVAVVAAVLALTGCSSSQAASGAPATSVAPPAVSDANAALAPLAISPLSDIAPVLGADNRIHLAYELQIINQGRARAVLTGVDTLDPSGAVITSLKGADLGKVFRAAGGSGGDGLAGGQAGDLFLDATLPAGSTVPRSVQHRFTVTLTPPTDAGPSGDAPPPAPPTDLTFTGVSVDVSDQQAVEVAPPLRGGGWVAGNGCCDAITAHRGATLSVDGTIRVAQRFAIDFVQIGPTGTLYTGDPASNTSFPFFGVQVHSAADGTVVRVLDGNPEQIPGKLPEGQTLQSADGNYVVVDIGNGRYAFYAHLQPGSLKVEVGDRVKTGDVLGLLGNTGNTDAPHLHFHIMDGPSPLESNGLPFVLTRFTGTGVVTDESKIIAPFPAQAPVVPVDTSRLAGAHTGQLPLNLEVVDLG